MVDGARTSIARSLLVASLIRRVCLCGSSCVYLRAAKLGFPGECRRCRSQEARLVNASNFVLGVIRVEFALTDNDKKCCCGEVVYCIRSNNEGRS